MTFEMPSDGDDLDQRLADFLRFTGQEPRAEKTIFILVMGMTGAGKSTLIRHCTGSNVEVVHGLQSCTNNHSVHSFFHEGQHVHMIDTPGFDDTNRSDIDTLKTISCYPSASFANGIRISGIIYLHRISDNRLGGAGMRNLRMFKKLSGAATWPNTVIGTTMWEANEFEQGEKRETELGGSSDYFGDMLAGGAKLSRIAEYGTGELEQACSSFEIVSYLIRRARILPEIDLSIQRELFLDKKTLDATSACQEALGELYLVQQKFTAEMESTRKNMQDALKDADMVTARMIQTQAVEWAKQIDEAKKQQKDLETSLMEMHDRGLIRLQTRLEDMEHRQRDILDSKQRELDDMKSSIEHMLHQSAVDEARWNEKPLDKGSLQKKRQVSKDLNREAEASLAVLEQRVAQERKNVRAVDQAKTKVAVRANVLNGG